MHFAEVTEQAPWPETTWERHLRLTVGGHEVHGHGTGEYPVDPAEY